MTTPFHLRPGAKQRRVVCAANRVRCGFGSDSDAIVCAPRHLDPIMRRQMANSPLGPKAWRKSEQGFIDQWGTFMDRTEAFAVATAAGQLLYGSHLYGAKLDSSDLY